MSDMQKNEKSTDYCFEQFENKLWNELNSIKKEVDDLYVTVYKGNGSPSLVTRVNSVEGKLRGLRESLDEKISHISKENNLKFDSIHQKLESKFGRLEGYIETKLSGMETLIRTMTEQQSIERTESWKVKVAVISAIAAIITAVATYFSK